MVRTRTSSRVVTLCILCCLAGCQSAEKAALTPLAPDAPPPTFAELMSRGKQQISAAHEFYYTDRWKDLEQAAVAIKETGSYVTKLTLPSATEAQKAKLATLTKDFTDAADQLKSAGAEQNPTKTSQVFQKLHEAYRLLRVEQMVIAPVGSGAPTAPTTPGTPEKKQ